MGLCDAPLLPIETYVVGKSCPPEPKPNPKGVVCRTKFSCTCRFGVLGGNDLVLSNRLSANFAELGVLLGKKLLCRTLDSSVPGVVGKLELLLGPFEVLWFHDGKPCKLPAACSMNCWFNRLLSASPTLLSRISFNKDCRSIMLGTFVSLRRLPLPLLEGPLPSYDDHGRLDPEAREGKEAAAPGVR